MRTLCIPLSLALAAGSANAQISEIAAMTVPASQVHMGSLVGGLTSTGAINAAGTNGGACFCEITAIPKAVVLGVFNTNANCSLLGLGGDPSVPSTQDPQPLFLTPSPAGTFNSVTFRLCLAKPHTEIGIGIGDWNGPLVLSFYLGGVLQATFTSTSYTSTACVKFYQMVGGSFDRVDYDASTTGGNFVTTELWSEQCRPTSLSIGRGCLGTLGVPTISGGNPPIAGTTFNLNVANVVGPYFLVLGTSSYASPGLGLLPFDLGIIGAPGCSLNCRLDMAVPAGGAVLPLAIPPGVAVCLCLQVLALDPPANPLGLTASNGLKVFIR